MFVMPADSGSKFITFHIICNRCKEEIIVKASKTSDISRLYEGSSKKAPAGFVESAIQRALLTESSKKIGKRK